MEYSQRAERANAELEAAIGRMLAARAERALSQPTVWQLLVARLVRR